MDMTTGLSCPSAQADQIGSVVIGVVRGHNGGIRVSLLPDPARLRAVAHLIPDTLPVAEVVRLAAPCAERRCAHFHDGCCSLASRIVAKLPAVIDHMSKCAIRPSCRWWYQEGPVACFRCPAIVTEPFQASDLMREVATPSSALTDQNRSTGDSNHV